VLIAGPPPIPASHKAARWDAHARDHLMMWVHTGHAHIRVAGGEHLHVPEGTGVWLPPGADHEMWTGSGSLAFPLAVPSRAVPGAPEQVTRFTVADGWRDRLIALFAQGAQAPGDLDGPAGDLLGVFTGAGPGPAGRSATAGADGCPPVPRSAAAGRVARELRRNPSLDHTVEQWAAAVACSPNTLRREFLRETGLPFARWRTLCRLAAAGEYLAAGHRVEQVAARVGFASRHSFARAFRERYGISPRDHAARSAAGDAASLRDGVRRETEEPAEVLGGTPGGPPTAGSARTSNGVGEDNELIWIYRGEVRARVGARSLTAKRGDAFWVPAGTAHETRLPAGSIAIPVSTVCTDCVQIPEPLSTRFSPSWDTYLLHCSVSGNTLLHPVGYHVRHIVGVFDEQLAIQSARTVPMPKDERARRAANDFLRRIGTDAQRATLDVPAEVHDSFRRETGMTFASWRHAARMRIARDLLTSGAKPSGVAVRVGYTHLPNFSRAFARFHGMAPRDWQEHEREAS